MPVTQYTIQVSLRGIKCDERATDVIVPGKTVSIVQTWKEETILSVYK